MGRHEFSRVAIFLALLLAVGSLALGCDSADDGTTPGGAAGGTLPTLTLTDDTPELLLTWFDERGRSHTGISLKEVPDGSKKMVRVITRDAGHGGVFYVADLSTKNADGSYPVRSMRRSEWEAALAKMRAAYKAKHAPPAQPKAPDAPDAPPPSPDGANTVSAIVYGASWCRPCHQAAAFLKQRGVKVVEHDIEKTPRYAKEMQAKLKRAGKRGGSIPVIDVGGIILQGFSRGALSRAVNQAKGSGTRL
jgi:glutaredoxin